MRTIIMGLAMIMAVYGCSAKNTLGDGQIDLVEAAVVRVAVGAAMSSRPELVVPAYGVSTALLQLLGGEEVATVSTVEDAVAKQIATMDLPAAERQSALDLLALIQARILADLPDNEADHLLVIKKMVQIVNEAARGRLEP